MSAGTRKLMPDDPITFATLMQYHREVLLPDVQRLISESEQRVRDEMHTGFDAVYQRLDRLETEYQMLVAGLRRVEERLDRLEGRMDHVEIRLDAIEGRMGALEGRMDTLEHRMSSMEPKLDKVALRSELEALKARVDDLQAQILVLEDRLRAS